MLVLALLTAGQSGELRQSFSFVGECCNVVAVIGVEIFYIYFFHLLTFISLVSSLR